MQGLVLALFGACVGSFTNVVAWRLPRHESVVFPSSHFPRCGHAVRWHDNLPVVGWLLLLGHCRDCRSPISVRYPVVEALSAGLWLSAAYVQPSVGGVTCP
jgi:leader peptidase (prepilin peptidase)/N-methyltransferase